MSQESRQQGWPSSQQHTMSNRKDPERGHLDSEDSLLDEGQSVEMQNPLNLADPSILENLNSTANTMNTSNNPRLNLFSDDELSSAESSVAQPTNAPDDIESRCRASSEACSVMVGTLTTQPNLGTAPGEYGDTQNSPRPVAGADMTNEDLSNTGRIEAHYRISSEAGSVLQGTMRSPLGRTRDAYEDTENSPRPVAGDEMTNVDLGSTNRIMSLREANNGGGDGGGSGNDSGGNYGGKGKAGEDFTTAEPSPAMIVAGDGDAPSGGDEVTEVSCKGHAK